MFPGLTDDEIYQLEVGRVWSAVVEKLSQISVQSPARLRLELHTLARENFSSMKKFIHKVFLIVRQLRAAGKVISGDEIKGVLELGVDRNLYAIQIDKWTTDEDDVTSVQITHELIILEREHLKRAGTSHSHLLAARALLVRSGLTVTDTAPSSTTPHLIPSPNEAAVCSYCGMENHSLWKPVGERSGTFNLKTLLTMLPLVHGAVPDARSSLALLTLLALMDLLPLVGIELLLRTTLH